MVAAAGFCGAGLTAGAAGLVEVATTAVEVVLALTWVLAVPFIDTTPS